VSARRVVLLVGSARPPGTGNSEALGGYLLARLAEGGMDIEVFHVHRCQRPEKERLLLEAVDGADLFVLSTPLYVDSLLALVNCGFPEWEHTRTAIDICRVFARQASFVWAGGLGLGGGEAIGGRSLEEVGGMTRHVRRGLDVAAEALLDDRIIPEEAQALLARPMIPSRLYTFIGDIGWLKAARRQGTLRRLRDRPLR